jgi:hypothetical protein
MSAPKIYHLADRVSAQGKVSALCFKRPKAIDLKKALWTIRDAAVTCAECLAIMRADRVYRRLFVDKIKCGEGCWSSNPQAHPMVSHWHGADEDAIRAAIREELKK